MISLSKKEDNAKKTPDPVKEELTHVLENEKQGNPTLIKSGYKFGGGGGTDASKR